MTVTLLWACHLVEVVQHGHLSDRKNYAIMGLSNGKKKL